LGLLTSIFTLADAKKLQEKLTLSKDFNWAGYVESLKVDSTQSAQLKSFESLNFSRNFVASASVKIDVNKDFQLISFLSTKNQLKKLVVQDVNVCLTCVA
jgi:hypothetical protein